MSVALGMIPKETSTGARSIAHTEASSASRLRFVVWAYLYQAESSP